MSHIAFSGGIAIWAIKDGTYEYKNFTGTAAGLQAAIEYVAGGTGEVFIGPGTLLHAVGFQVHGGCRIRGSGKGVTTLRRSALDLVGGAAYYGNTFTTTAVGATTPPALGAALADISLEDMTLDGNQSGFTQGVNPGSVRHMGVFAQFTNRILVRNLEVKNFIQSGINFDACANVLVYGCHVHETGQCTVASSRNGINFVNNQSAPAPYAMNCTITACTIETVNDTAVDFGNVQNVVFTDSICRNCLTYTIEIEPTTVPVTKNITIANVISTGNQHQFISIPAPTGVTISNIRILNCYIEFDVGTAGMWLVSSAGGYIDDVLIEGCTLRWATLEGTSFGASIYIYGNVSHTRVKNCYIENAPGIACQLQCEIDTENMSDIEIDGLHVNQGNNYGVLVAAANNIASTIKRVRISNCVFRDVCQLGTNFAAIGIAQTGTSASQVVQDITVIHNKTYRISGVGTFQYGVRLYQQASGTLDKVDVLLNDFRTVSVAAITVANGTVTNLRFLPIPGRGADITAGATISIPTIGTVFHVTGNTNITNGITVNQWDGGRTIKLIFDGTPTVSDTGTSQLAGNFVAAANASLVLSCDGTNWNEDSRSLN